MTWIDRVALFSTLDGAALALLVIIWLGIGWRIELSSARHLSTSQIMAGYRREWMRQMITRQPRIFDAQVVAMDRIAERAGEETDSVGNLFCLSGTNEIFRVRGLA